MNKLLPPIFLCFVCLLIGTTACGRIHLGQRSYYLEYVKYQNDSLPYEVRKICNWNSTPVVIKEWEENFSVYDTESQIIYLSKRNSKQLIHEYAHHLDSTVSKKCLMEIRAYHLQKIHRLERELRMRNLDIRR